MSASIKFTVLIAAVLLLNSCAFHSGNITGSASLSQPNFKVIGTVYGTSSAQYVLGIGGLTADKLILLAKQDLLTKYPLKKGQALANVTVERKHSFYFLYSKVKITVTADIVNFYPTNNIPDEIDSAITIPVLSEFKTGEKVYYKSWGSFSIATIQQILNNGKVKIILPDINTGKISNYNVSEDNLYKLNNKYSYAKPYSYNVKDELKDDKNGKTLTITGFGKNAVLTYSFKDNGDKYYKLVPYTNLPLKK